MHERRLTPGHARELLTPGHARELLGVGAELEDVRVDDVDASRERLLGLGGRPLPVVALDLDDLEAARSQLLEVRVLVLVALAADQLRLGVVDRGPLDGGELEPR